MPKSFLIDGYNLMFRVVGGRILSDEALEAARNRFLLRLETLGRLHKLRMIVVFDGRSSRGATMRRFYGMKVLFSKPPESADALIKRMLDQTSRSASWTVVTSDQEIAAFARRCGAPVLSSLAFIQTYMDPPDATETPKESSERPLSEVEIEEWMRLFRERAPGGEM